VPGPQSRARFHLSLHFRVRPVLVRWLVSALSLALTVIVVPHVYFSGGHRILSWLLISAVFGLLVACVKPLVQLLLLPLIFVSFGLVVVLINAVIIWLLAVMFPERFHAEHLLWLLVAGLVSGLLVALFENVLGLAPPIVLGQPEALRIRIARAKSGYVEGELLDAAVSGTQKLHEIAGKDDAHDGDGGGS
jgi:putative membrane protein